MGPQLGEVLLERVELVPMGAPRQERVALAKCSVGPLENRQSLRSQLEAEPVEKAPSVVWSPPDEGAIVTRQRRHRQEIEVLRGPEPARTSKQGPRERPAEVNLLTDLDRCAGTLCHCRESKTAGAMPDPRRGRTGPKRREVSKDRQRFEETGLARAVGPNDSRQARWHIQLLCREVAKLRDGEPCDRHTTRGESA